MGATRKTPVARLGRYAVLLASIPSALLLPLTPLFRVSRLLPRCPVNRHIGGRGRWAAAASGERKPERGEQSVPWLVISMGRPVQERVARVGVTGGTPRLTGVRLSVFA